MSFVNMTQTGNTGSYRYSETLTDTGYGIPIIFPHNTTVFTCALIIKEDAFDKTGSADVQLTSDTIEEIDNGTADWVSWDFGLTSKSRLISGVPPSAIRQANHSGITKITVIAK